MAPGRVRLYYPRIAGVACLARPHERVLTGPDPVPACGAGSRAGLRPRDGRTRLRHRARLPGEHQHDPRRGHVPALRLRGRPRRVLAARSCIILLGHAVTIPTALAIAEIATNRRVEGGGEYFIISPLVRNRPSAGRSASSLYLSQAISVAFYMIAFAEAFRPLAAWIERPPGVAFDPRISRCPATLLLTVADAREGADLGVQALWVVVAMLAVSLSRLLPRRAARRGARWPRSQLTSASRTPTPSCSSSRSCFPAFTGMTAGVGLSGDLANPRRVDSARHPVRDAAGHGDLRRRRLQAGGLRAARRSWPATSSSWRASRLGARSSRSGSPCATVSLGDRLDPGGAAHAAGAGRRRRRCRCRALNALRARAGEGEANEPRNATLLTAAIALVVRRRWATSTSWRASSRCSSWSPTARCARSASSSTSPRARATARASAPSGT